MSKRKTLKETITEVVLAQLPDSLNQEKTIPVDKLLFKWWMTGRQDGLRLTDVGDYSFRMAEIEFYQYELKLQPETQYHAYILELNNLFLKWSCFFRLLFLDSVFIFPAFQCNIFKFIKVKCILAIINYFFCE